MEKKECKDCIFYEDGLCDIKDELVDEDETCDEWEGL